jgi:hypothetical protein
VPLGRFEAEISDHRHCWLLRASRERQDDGYATEKRDELPTLHSITSPAATCRESGTSNPIAFAVLAIVESISYYEKGTVT